MKSNFSKMGRLSNAAKYIRKEKKVSLTKLAAYFNLCNEYARKEFRDIEEFFPDIEFDGKYFYALELEEEKSSEGTSSERTQNEIIAVNNANAFGAVNKDEK
ncbi:MAG: hypothetical protein QXS54_05855 [Candidatus Methanomethylicaceae archaeon]